ncbi:hypothetical protein LZ30DRAFT_50869 [Colletotrichum cereale]|nr:hypothetical protein LZ30DRAFT_50869 [Colletotrichum cereale]
MGGVAAACLSRRSSGTRCGDGTGIHPGMTTRRGGTRTAKVRQPWILCNREGSAPLDGLILWSRRSKRGWKQAGHVVHTLSAKRVDATIWGGLRGSCTAATSKHNPGFPALVRCSNAWLARENGGDLRRPLPYVTMAIGLERGCPTYETAIFRRGVKGGIRLLK